MRQCPHFFFLVPALLRIFCLIVSFSFIQLSHKIISYILHILYLGGLCLKVNHPETWTINERPFLFICYLSVGFYITEENTTFKSKIESPTFFFSYFHPNRKKEIKPNSFSCWGKPERVQIQPANSLSSSKNPHFFFPTPPILLLPHFSLLNFLEWKHNGCAEWTRVARRRHEDNEVSRLLISFLWLGYFFQRRG